MAGREPMRNRWHLLGSLLLILAGCRHATPDLKPPPQPDEYTLPSEDERRYNQLYQYPKNANDPSLLAPAQKTPLAARREPGPGALVVARERGRVLQRRSPDGPPALQVVNPPPLRRQRNRQPAVVQIQPRREPPARDPERQLGE